MIRNVFIDLDDTLLDFGKAEAVALRKALTLADIPVTDELIARYSKINAAQWAKLERGELTRQEVLVRRFDILFEEYGIKKSSLAVQDDYERLLAIGHWFIDGAPELLEALSGKYRLYLASNGTASVQAGRIKSAGIGKYFDECFVSEHIGYNKPSREYFEACFAKIPDFKREESIMVGDGLGSDILGGINAGIKTCWFNPKGLEPRPGIQADFEIQKLSQLPELLRKL